MIILMKIFNYQGWSRSDKIYFDKNLLKQCEGLGWIKKTLGRKVTMAEVGTERWSMTKERQLEHNIFQWFKDKNVLVGLFQCVNSGTQVLFLWTLPSLASNVNVKPGKGKCLKRIDCTHKTFPGLEVTCRTCPHIWWPELCHTGNVSLIKFPGRMPSKLPPPAHWSRGWDQWWRDCIKD